MVLKGKMLDEAYMVVGEVYVVRQVIKQNTRNQAEMVGVCFSG